MSNRHANAASAPTRAEEPPPTEQPATDGKASTAKAPARSRKKTRFQPTGHRRGGTAYDKLKPTTSIQTTSRLTNFQLFLSNIGCRSLALIVYNVLCAKDYRLGQSITALQLAYVLNLSFLNRCVQTAIRYGYAFTNEASRLKEVATGIMLPTVLEKYITAIGRFELASTACIVPYVRSYRDWCVDSPYMIDPADLLREANRPVPNGDWAIDHDWVISYNNATTRASRYGMNFHIVDNSAFDGRVEMAVSYEEQDGMLVPYAPQTTTSAEIQLGAVYRYRNYELRRLLPGDNVELAFNAFTTSAFVENQLFSDMCVAAFTGSHISTE